jgi:hypothetical protein
MATPDFEYRPDYIDWAIQPDFTVEDQQFACSMTGLPKKDGEVVYQGAVIEGEGHFTITQYSAEQLARLIGWVDPDELPDTDDLYAEIAALQSTVDEQESLIDQLQTTIRLLTTKTPTYS